ncbi:MAG TPA: hypothetical protein VKB96_00980 [Gammaproteobacteria bacterium]|nr:hypothetical protein [Gammaproteobacteria bacterium]
MPRIFAACWAIMLNKRVFVDLTRVEIVVYSARLSISSADPLASTPAEQLAALCLSATWK